MDGLEDMVKAVFNSRIAEDREVLFMKDTELNGKVIKAGKKGHFDMSKTLELLKAGSVIFSIDYVPEPIKGGKKSNNK